MYKLSLNDYDITKNGEIIRLKTNKSLKLQKNSKGYYRVQIGQKRYFVHKLVAQKYIPNPLNKEQVNHKNGIKTDNRVENLEWVSNYENRKHALENGLQPYGEKCSYSKLKKSDVIYIRNNRHITNKVLAKIFNVSLSAISSVKNYRSWKNI